MWKRNTKKEGKKRRRKLLLMSLNNCLKSKSFVNVKLILEEGKNVKKTYLSVFILLFNFIHTKYFPGLNDIVGGKYSFFSFLQIFVNYSFLKIPKIV